MPSEKAAKRKSLLKSPLLYTSSILAVALLTVVYVMVSRWEDARNRERQAERERLEKQQTEDKIAVEQLGGKNFAIVSFYASPPSIRRGESTQLCYGVSNAKKVRLEPQTQPVWPSVAHCVDVSPPKSTTYTLTIEDAAGHTQSQDIDVKVR